MNPEHDIETRPDPYEDEWQETDEAVNEADLWWEWVESW